MDKIKSYISIVIIFLMISVFANLYLYYNNNSSTYEVKHLQTDSINIKNKEILNSKINQWHKDAADSNLESYLSFMAEDAIYIGTDASERWTKAEFKEYCQPHFKASKTWTFKPKNRHIEINKNIAWFDELLSTSMGVCRATGIIVKTKNKWYLHHYQLSVTIDNDKLSKFIKISE